MPPITIVLDGNQRSALATTRSLGKHGVPVIVGDAVGRTLAGSSRYCQSQWVYPDPARHPAEFQAWLRSINASHAGAVILPMTDLTVPLVLHTAADIPDLRTMLPTPSDYAAASDKRSLFELASQVGVRVPRTLPVTRATVAELARIDLHYPVVVKPRMSAMRLNAGVTKRTVRYANDREALLRLVDRELLDDTDELLVQEFIQGLGAGVFALYDSGKPLYFFAHRRIREKPPSGGVSVLSESVEVSENGKLAARKLLDALNWNGAAMVEFKLDADGQLWLIEINARFWGSLQLAVDAGADFPWMVYQLATGQKPETSSNYRAGCRLRWWLGDLDNLYAQLKDRRWTPTVGAKLRACSQFLFSPGARNEILRWGDIGPAFHEARGYLAAFRQARH